MSCPYFWPSEPCSGDRPVPARTPLGRLYEGRCTAAGDGELSVEHCNFGYARGNCSRFPEGSTADAVRFSSYGDDVMYVLESAYSPVESGPVARLTTGSVLQRQCEIYLANTR